MLIKLSLMPGEDLRNHLMLIKLLFVDAVEDLLNHFDVEITVANAVGDLRNYFRY